MDTASSQPAPALMWALFLGLALGAPARAQGQEADAPSYAAFYGDGLQAYAEGRYGEAVAHLFRAYALRPSPHVLKTIVRSYDFMGHCGAVERQLQWLREEHPRQVQPALQRCVAPGTLQLECTPRSTPLVIDNMIEAQCGTALRLTEGTHVVTAVELGISQRVEIMAGEVSTATLQLPMSGARGEGEGEATASTVQRLEQEDRYNVIQLPDGLYYIWVLRPRGADEDPRDVPPRLVIPRVDAHEDGYPGGFPRVR